MKRTTETKETKKNPAKKAAAKDVQTLPPVKATETKAPEAKAKPAPAAKTSTPAFRPGTKTAQIVDQLKKGLTFAALQEFVAKKFGKESANTGNVRQYIANIREKGITVADVDGTYKIAGK